MNKSLWVISCILIIVGLMLLIAGIADRYYQAYKEGTRRKSVAKVVDLVLQEPDRKEQLDLFKNYYYPVIEYYAEGKLYKTIHPHGSYPSRYQIGQEIRIRYEKDEPQEYEVEVSSRRQITSELLYGTGVFCIAVGAIIFLIFAVRG